VTEKRVIRVRTLAVVAAGMLSVALTSAPQIAQAESVLRIAMTAGDIPDWVGQPDQGFEGYRFVGFNLYEGLSNWDLSTAGVEVKLKPGLATKWQVDEADQKKWIFELRKGVKFHDGCEWNADVALWNLERLTSEKSPAFSPAQFARGRSRTNDIDRFEKIDDYTIAIYTKKVVSLFPYNTPFVLMMSKCAMEKAGNDHKAYAAAPAGTGPYKFSKVIPRERLELVKNADYWDAKRIPKHDRLVLLPMPEATTRAAALLAGQVEMIEAPSPDLIPRLKSAGMNVITHPYPHAWPYLLNFARGPFKDLRVRQAANYAINRDEMVDMLGGIAIPSYASFTEYQKNYGRPFQHKFNLEKATALLKEANCHPCAITIGISTSGSGQMQPLPMNELVKAQLEAAGFKVKFEVLDWNTVLDAYIRGWQKYPTLDGLNFSSGAIDPLSGIVKTYATMYRSPVGPNWGWYENKEVDALVDQLLATFDVAEQDKLLTKINEITTQDAARVFIVSDLNPRALSPKLKGFVQVQSWFQDVTPIVVSDK
jgi:peptide/nickel transport system substrate-binding protein